MSFNVCFEWVDSEGYLNQTIIKTNYKTNEKNIKKCKEICKKRKGIFLRIVSID